jgi:hypothetical protein
VKIGTGSAVRRCSSNTEFFRTAGSTTRTFDSCGEAGPRTLGPARDPGSCLSTLFRLVCWRFPAGDGRCCGDARQGAILRCVGSEVSSKHTDRRRRKLTVCAVCAVLNGLLAASSLVLFATETGPPDGESRVRAILPPVLVLTSLILLVACYVMHLALGKGQVDEDSRRRRQRKTTRTPYRTGALGSSRRAAALVASDSTARADRSRQRGLQRVASRCPNFTLDNSYYVVFPATRQVFAPRRRP